MSRTAAVNSPSRSRLARSVPLRSTAFTLNPRSVHAARTYAATAARRGFAAAVTPSTSSTYGAFAPGAIHLPSLRFQPAAPSALAAALVSYASVPAEAASNAQDV